MITEVVYFQHTEQVKTVYEKLSNCKHNGFPVVNEAKEVIGMISRNHLVTIIQHEYLQVEPAASAYAIVNEGLNTS